MITQKTKKAQGAIGFTLTQVFATFIVVVIVAIFMTFSFVLFKASSSQNGLQVLGTSDSRAVMASSFIAFLNAEDASGVSNKDLLDSWAKDYSADTSKKFLANYNNYLGSVSPECSLLKIAKEDEANSVSGIGNKDIHFYNNDKMSAYGSKNPTTVKVFSDYGINILLVTLNGNPVIQFYGGKCQLT